MLLSVVLIFGHQFIVIHGMADVGSPSAPGRCSSLKMGAPA